MLKASMLNETERQNLQCFTDNIPAEQNGMLQRLNKFYNSFLKSSSRVKRASEKGSAG